MTFKEITLPYLPQNLPPEIKAINILPAGVAFQKQPGVSMSRNPYSQTDQSAALASGASEAIASSGPVHDSAAAGLSKGSHVFYLGSRGSQSG